MKIRLSGHHCLTTICGVPYLLPYGQGIVDYERQLKLNDSAARLWGIIEDTADSNTACDRDLIISRLMKAEVPREDAENFLDTLLEARALLS